MTIEEIIRHAFEGLELTEWSASRIVQCCVVAGVLDVEVGAIDDSAMVAITLVVDSAHDPAEVARQAKDNLRENSPPVIGYTVTTRVERP